jgi:histidyl-tRNA synthetase
VGENEVASDTFAVKNLGSGEQVAVARAQLEAKLQQ